MGSSGGLPRATTLIGFLNPRGNPDGLQAVAQTGATAFAMEAIPRISRAQSMDALSSQANVAGYNVARCSAPTTRRASTRC